MRLIVKSKQGLKMTRKDGTVEELVSGNYINSEDYNPIDILHKCVNSYVLILANLPDVKHPKENLGDLEKLQLTQLQKHDHYKSSLQLVEPTEENFQALINEVYDAKEPKLSLLDREGGEGGKLKQDTKKAKTKA